MVCSFLDLVLLDILDLLYLVLLVLLKLVLLDLLKLVLLVPQRTSPDLRMVQTPLLLPPSPLRGVCQRSEVRGHTWQDELSS